MPVNPITGIVTYTLDEWKEESQLWEHNGALLERERIIELLMADNYFHFIIAGQEKHPIGCQMCQLIALIKGENK